MTDKEKLEKVRAEIERVKKNQEGVFTSYTDGKFDLCEHLLSFIDSMQEEPKECMYSKDNYTDEDRKVLCEGCEEECKFNKKEYSVNNGLDLGCGVIWKDEESISEDLEQAAQKAYPEDIHKQSIFIHGATYAYTHSKNTRLLDDGLEEAATKYAQDKYMAVQTFQAFKAGANWQKKQLTKAVKVNISNASIVSLPVNCNLKVGDKVLIIKEN